jgi:hypothetical protein
MLMVVTLEEEREHLNVEGEGIVVRVAAAVAAAGRWIGCHGRRSRYVYVAQNEGCATTFTWRQAGYASKFDQKKEKTKFIQW